MRMSGCASRLSLIATTIVILRGVPALGQAASIAQTPSAPGLVPVATPRPDESRTGAVLLSVLFGTVGFFSGATLGAVIGFRTPAAAAGRYLTVFALTDLGGVLGAAGGVLAADAIYGYRGRGWPAFVGAAIGGALTLGAIGLAERPDSLGWLALAVFAGPVCVIFGSIAANEYVARASLRAARPSASSYQLRFAPVLMPTGSSLVIAGQF